MPTINFNLRQQSSASTKTGFIQLFSPTMATTMTAADIEAVYISMLSFKFLLQQQVEEVKQLCLNRVRRIPFSHRQISRPCSICSKKT